MYPYDIVKFDFIIVSLLPVWQLTLKVNLESKWNLIQQVRLESLPFELKES